MSNLVRIKKSQNSAPAKAVHQPVLELKASAFTLPILRLGTCDPIAVEHELTNHLTQSLNFFKNGPIVIDLDLIRDSPDDPDFSALGRLLRNLQLIPVAVRGGSPRQHDAAIRAGLAVLKGGRDIKEAVTSASDNAAELLPNVAPPPQGNKVLIIEQPVRSGQRIHAVGADLIVLASVNYGAEVIADGNIHIYGTLRGRASAGAAGDVSARIFVSSLAAELVAIAGKHLIFEEPQALELVAKPLQIVLTGEELQILPLG